MSIKSLKTPLRYPGGKSKAIKTLSQWYPKIISEYREPFIGGGSIAIDITKSNPDIPVWINALYVPLFIFKFSFPSFKKCFSCFRRVFRFIKL